MNREELKVGSLYRGKRRRVNVFTGETDDRVIVYLNFDFNKIQYDSYFVRNGRYYPTTTIDKFLRWAKEEIKE